MLPPQSLLDLFRQSFFVPAAPITEKNCPDQIGKVHIVTGGYAGCGYELSKILYAANATIYVAGRSREKGDAAISKIKSAHPSSKGRLEYLQLDLADLTTIKASAEAFLAKESRLDVLTNNAGVMTPPAGSTTPQGHELQLGTNCLGPFLFTQLLLPVLKKTAAAEGKKGNVRVTWAGSLAVEFAPAVGVPMEEDGTVKPPGNDQMGNYAITKAGNAFYAREFARRYPNDGIISLAWNPGNLKTELQRHMPGIAAKFLDLFLLYPAINGAYTELYAAVSPEVGMEQNGGFVVPFGKVAGLRKLHASIQSKDEGGKGYPESFWFWSEKQTRQYM